VITLLLICCNFLKPSPSTGQSGSALWDRSQILQKTVTDPLSDGLQYIGSFFVEKQRRVFRGTASFRLMLKESMMRTRKVLSESVHNGRGKSAIGGHSTAVGLSDCHGFRTGFISPCPHGE